MFNFFIHPTLLLHRLKRHSGLVFVIVFGVIGFLGVLHHEFWGDELQAWMLARDSTSVFDLLHNMRLEGHPMLWHLSLLGLVQISRNPFVMQLFNLLIGVSTVYLVNYCSPFTTRQKFLLTFSYFILYEYTIISRSYGLGVFLAFLFCALTTRFGPGFLERPRRKVLTLRILVLVALANTSLYGLLLSVALSIYLLGEWVGWDLRNHKNLSLATYATSALRMPSSSIVILISGWLLSAAQIFRALRPGLLNPVPQVVDGAMQSSSLIHEQTAVVPSQVQASLGSMLPYIAKLGHLTAYIWKTYVPIPQLESPSFWNTSFFSDTPFLFGQLIPGLGGINLGQALSVLLSILLLFGVFRYCLQTPMVKWVYVVGNSLMFVLFYFYLPTGIRHHGHLFVLLLMCFWLDQSSLQADARANGRPINPLAQRFLSTVLLIHTLVGGYAYSVDWRYEFSGAAQAVQFIRQNRLENLPMVGIRTWETSVFPGYLDRKIYYPDQGLGSFVVPPSEYPSLSESWGLVSQFVSTHGPTLLILDKTISIEPLTISVPNLPSNAASNQLRIRLLGKFDGEIVTKETFFIYLVQPQ